jgi:hypothetical protein
MDSGVLWAEPGALSTTACLAGSRLRRSVNLMVEVRRRNAGRSERRLARALEM